MSQEEKGDGAEEARTNTDNCEKYKVAPRRMFESKYIKKVAQQKENDLQKQQALKEEQQMKIIQEEEKLPEDELHGQRVHYWVLVLPGNCRPEVQEAFFLEAASGRPFALSDQNYLGIEYVFNHEDFWFYKGDKNTVPAEFVLTDSEKWFGWRSFAGNNFEVPLSWMDRIEISLTDYQRRYPGEKKEILYLRSKLLKYSEYSRDDGMIMQLINYSDLNWENPTKTISHFKHRKDHLIKSEMDVRGSIVVDFYMPGRIDYVKAHTYQLANDENREICFFGKCHPLSLQKLTILSDTIVEEFQELMGESCILKRVLKYYSTSKNEKLIEWTEEYYTADNKLPPGCQVAKRKYFHLENRIFLKFHRNQGQLTAGYLHFLKPTAPNVVEMHHAYRPFKGDLQKDFDPVFSKHLADEKKIILHAQGLHAEIGALLQNLGVERSKPDQKISIFDEERNLETVRQMKLRDSTLYQNFMNELLDPVDYTAPIVEKFGSRRELMSEDEISSFEEEIGLERAQSNSTHQKNLDDRIKLLTTDLQNREASEQKNQLLQVEKDEIEKLKLKIEALKFRQSRIE